MLFMGGEFGQWSEWDFDRHLDWNLLKYEPHEKLKKYVQDLNGLYAGERAMYEVDFDHSGFEWIDFSDADASVISFIRRAKDPGDFLVFVLNFTPVPRLNYKVGVPLMSAYEEIFNSDSEVYWGSNLGNAGHTEATGERKDPWQYSINITLPPLGMLVFKPAATD
jgi:1,4-alpha-glucan branching enzyme